MHDPVVQPVVGHIEQRADVGAAAVEELHRRVEAEADLADAFVLLPGGFGSWEEFCEVVTWSQLELHAKPYGLLNVANYYDSLLALTAHAVAEGFVRTTHHQAIVVADDANVLLDQLAIPMRHYPDFLAEEAEPHLRGVDQGRWLDRLEVERIPVVVLTHFHEDHVAGLATLVELAARALVQRALAVRRGAGEAIALLLVSAEWPMHDLSEGYLYTAHMIQHIILTLLVAPLLLASCPSWMARALLPPRIMRVARTLARPMFALALFNFMIVFTHWPVLVTGTAWLAVFHHRRYPLYRNAFLLSGALGMIVFLTYPVAPPRFLTDHGFVDTVLERSRSYRVLQPPSLANLYAALQALKLFPLENQTVQKALDDLHRSATKVVEREGVIEIGLVGDFIFINDVRIRLDLGDPLDVVIARLHDVLFREGGYRGPTAAEYHDPTDRRFHAQPIACPNCGPFVALRETHSKIQGLNSKVSSIECRTSAILKARRLLREGYILAIKGLGGFHLACDASNSLSVEELRDRKGRVDKPFALMASDIDVVRSICQLNSEEEALLTGREKSIVLLEKKPHNERAAGAAFAPRSSRQRAGRHLKVRRLWPWRAPQFPGPRPRGLARGVGSQRWRPLGGRSGSSPRGRGRHSRRRARGRA